MDFSVASLTFVSVPAPPSKESLPPRPLTVSLPPPAQITSAPKVPEIVSADAVPWIVQVLPLVGGAVPQSGLWAWTPVPGVRLRGSEAAQAVSALSDRVSRAAAGVVAEDAGGASTAQMSLCPARSLVKVIWVPSGDHAGSVSQSGWLLTLMGSPLPSAFLTKISPLPSKPLVLS